MSTTTLEPETPVPPVDGRGKRRRRGRRTVVAAVAAVVAATAVGGAARADDGVASSAQGALVDIVTTAAYEGYTAAGTGMILTSDGEVLTNNHVVDGATSIRVTVVATGQSYAATVVGTDPTDDVAVIQLTGASGLETIPIGDSDDLAVGDSVTASGNANGDGGEPSVVTGTVTGLDRSITATDENGGDAEQLTGLIETNAPIVAGDSGGALADGDGDVVGMNTAAAATNSTAAAGFRGASATTTEAEAYAIPIETALAIAQKIEAGDASSTIHIGTHGFLGVAILPSGYRESGYGATGFGSTTDDAGGAVVAQVFDGATAATAGLAAGDVITSVAGQAVDSPQALSEVMATTKSGQQVTLGWTDTDGTAQTATVTLSPAPAD